MGEAGFAEFVDLGYQEWLDVLWRCRLFAGDVVLGYDVLEMLDYVVGDSCGLRFDIGGCEYWDTDRISWYGHIKQNTKSSCYIWLPKAPLFLSTFSFILTLFIVIIKYLQIPHFRKPKHKSLNLLLSPTPMIPIIPHPMIPSNNQNPILIHFLNNILNKIRDLFLLICKLWMSYRTG